MRALLQVLVASACLSVSGIVLAQAATAPGATANTAPASAPNAAPWFARVNNVEISVAQFDQAAKEAFRKKFYHGTPPESEVNLMLREVAESIIDQMLLQRELVARKIAADQNEVKSELDKLEQRYASSPAWQQQREQALPNLRAHFEDKSRLKVLENSIRDVKASAAEVRAFYDKNLPLFTEPEKDRLSIILLRVDPSSPSKEWEDVRQQAEKIKAEIIGGADFAQLAKERSKDRSASNGGDLGYLHRGMIAPAVEAEISTVAIGALGGPTRTLEGYVVYRVDGRIISALRDFSASEPRARELFLREKSDETWLNYLASLRKTAKIELNPDFDKIMQAEKPSAAPAN